MPFLMRRCLEGGQYLILGGAERIDEDIPIGSLSRLIEDSGSGETGGCQEGEIGGGGARVGYSGGF